MIRVSIGAPGRTRTDTGRFLSPLVRKNEFPTPTKAATNTPGAVCSPAGAIGKSSSGVTHTCKTSPTGTRNRWRQ